MSLKPFSKPFAAIATIATALSVSADPPAGTNWVKTFSDEFNGTILDLTKWMSGNNWGQINGEPQGYQASQISIVNGKCVLTCEIKENVYGGKTMRYASGEISSKGKFSQKYGYFEASCKLPRGKGMWPAFWGMPQEGGWAPEVDIMEKVNEDDGIVQAYNTNWFTNKNYPNSGGGMAQQIMNGAGVWGVDLSAGFHTFAMDWTSTYAKFYTDGKLYGTVTQNCAPYCSWYMLFDLALKTVNEAYLPATFEIDWIRIWQRAELVGIAEDRLPIMPRVWNSSQSAGIIGGGAFSDLRDAVDLTNVAGRILVSPATAQKARPTGLYILQAHEHGPQP